MLVSLHAVESRAATNAVEVQGLVKRFGEFVAVDHLDLALRRGQLTSLLGPNGAGKTTTVRILTTLMAPTEGEVWIGGYRLPDDHDRIKPLLGLVPQEIALYELLSARQNLQFFGRLYGLRGKALDDRVTRLLDGVPLSDRADDRLGTFSGGMQRRVNIAAALVHDPEIIFMDEPTVGLDPISRAAIWESWDDMHAGDQLPAPRLLMPVRETDVVINALPYEMSSSGQSFQRCLQGMASALVVPVGKGGFYSDPYKTAKIMAELQASVLITTPPYAMLLSEVAQHLGLTLGTDIRLRFIWLTGEGCSAAYRRRLEELWHCQGLIFYGSMECGSVGIECTQQAGGHVSLGHVYVEIVDPKTAQPLPAGEVGEVVCTVLQRKASPLIRFRTQDLAYLDPAPCPCGVRFPRLHIRGRIADQISGEGAQQAGPPVSPYVIEEVLYRQPEMGGNYQIYTSGQKL